MVFPKHFDNLRLYRKMKTTKSADAFRTIINVSVNFFQNVPKSAREFLRHNTFDKIDSMLSLAVFDGN